MFEDKDFELLQEETPVNENVVDDVEISDDDFTLTQIDESVHEQKIQTKPTTFLKDSLRRFRKNKSSVVAAYILGILLLMSFLVPIIDRNDTREVHEDYTFLAPKLFKSGTGFWDGTAKYKNIPVDISANPNPTGTPEEIEAQKQEDWWPDKDRFSNHRAISKKKFTDQEYINDSTAGAYAKDGYVQFGYLGSRKEGDTYDFTSRAIENLTLNNDLYLDVFDVYDVNKIHLRENNETFQEPDNYHLGECALYFKYQEEVNREIFDREIQLIDYKLVHNIGSFVTTLAEPKLNIAEIIQNETGQTTFQNAQFAVRMVVDNKDRNTCSLIGGISFEYSNAADENTQKKFEAISFTSASPVVAVDPNSDKIRSKVIDSGKDEGKPNYKYWSYWSSTDIRRVYLAKAYFCSFTYDTYEAAFGKIDQDIALKDLINYEKEGWISLTSDVTGQSTLYDTEDTYFGYCLDVKNFTCKILEPDKCPLAEPITLKDLEEYEKMAVYYDEDYVYGFFPVKATFWQYKLKGLKSIPKFLMGTDRNGRDLFKYVFEGLRTSLLLGFLTFIVCFLFGLAWGAICGYFGGTVDLLMERFTDILAGIPWIVVMTLVIIHMGSNFWTFALALCMTGWIGTAARTRTQFYRFRGREYVLASRTLGASDARLITKHILPNSLGTIITGAVLMIPSVIFSEATISYLGLGLQNIASLGVILSKNQVYLKTDPYLLIFPSVIIALIMISFNLFGNGLRDAINPSLKGEEQ